MDILFSLLQVHFTMRREMLDIYTVAFFGHRYIDNPLKVEKLLEEQIRKLINENDYVEFLVGRNGDFDRCVSSSVLRVRKNQRDDNSALVLVLPYYTSEYLNNEESFQNYYTDAEISHAASISHPKSAIQIRNRKTVDRADLVICYIEEKRGGAYNIVQYAKRQRKILLTLPKKPCGCRIVIFRIQIKKNICRYAIFLLKYTP